MTWAWELMADGLLAEAGGRAAELLRLAGARTANLAKSVMPSATGVRFTSTAITCPHAVRTS